MENKNPIFSIKNFRSFGEEGADFELAPITVLTGCNSAGKSSLVKAQILLSRVAEEISQRWECIEKRGVRFHAVSLRELFSELTLHVSDKELQLGRFDRALNTQSDSKTINYSYTTFSKYLLKDITVELSFSGKDDEVVNDAVLTHLCVRIDNTVLVEMSNLDKKYERKIFSSFLENEHINYLCLLDSFKKIMVFSFAEKWLDEYMNYQMGLSELSKEELDNRKKNVEELVKKMAIELEMEKYKNIRWIANIAPPYEAIDEYLKTQSLYSWLPIFDSADNITKAQVRELLLEKALAVCNSPEDKMPVDWVNHFCDDFESSKYNSLTDYFHALERNALSTGNIDDSGNSPLKFRGTGVAYTLGDDENPVFREETYEAANRMSREEYDKQYSFISMIDSLEELFFKGQPIDPFSLDHIIPYKGDVIRSLKAFARIAIVDAVVSDFLEDITYINSSSTLVRRLYVLDDNDKIGNAINQFLQGNKQRFISNGHSEVMLRADEKYKYSPRTFLDKWCNRFGMGKIYIEGSEQGLGAMVYVEKNGKKRLMADEGYGITQLFTLLLQIENRILNASRRDVSHGRSADYSIDYAPQYICVEEPEIHLHPKYQSLLADMFVEAYQKYNIHFIVETHSEYLIRKLQVMVADKENKFSPNDVSINYVDNEDDGIAKNKKIDILEDGRLSEPFGPGFYDEADTLAMDLMKYKARRK